MMYNTTGRLHYIRSDTLEHGFFIRNSSYYVLGHSFESSGPYNYGLCASNLGPFLHLVNQLSN